MIKTKVFLAEPQVLFREGIHFILSGEEDVDVIGETTSNEEALSLIESNPPDVAILNYDDPKLNGIEITKHIRRNMPSTYVVLIMDKKEPEKIFECMKCDVSACLSKDSDPDQLLDTVKVVAQGVQPIIDELFNPEVAALVLNEFADIAAYNEQFENLLANLTPREAQIMSLITEGNSLEQTAAKANLDIDAIRHSVRIILTKLIANEHTTHILEMAQRNLNFLLRPGKGDGSAKEYVTRGEFNDFKDQLAKRFRLFVGDAMPGARGKE